MTAIQTEDRPGWFITQTRAALVGGAVWAAAVVVLRPSPFDPIWARMLLLFAPLVLVPLGLRLVASATAAGGADKLWRAVEGVQLPAALSLGGAFLLPPGPVAAALSVPWAAATGLMALFGLRQLWRRPNAPLHELCLNAALVFVVVGSGWAILDRFGARPLDFEPVIVLLTAIHFHYAGFVLPLAAAFAIREAGGRIGWPAGVAVILGVPLVALGITATQLQWGTWLECAAAWVMATAGVLVSGLHVRLAWRRAGSPLVRSLWAVAAASLAASMVLAALYGSRFYLPIAWLDIPWMRAVHGSANAIGFGLASLSGWAWAVAPAAATAGDMVAKSRERTSEAGGDFR